MTYPIQETLAIVANHSSPSVGWIDLIDLFRASYPDVPWDSLPNLNLEHDIAAATAWLSAQLETVPDAIGIYLGLDTLNMDDGNGKNLEFGGSPDCDANQDEADWVYDIQLTYGTEHLIHGLYELQQIYQTEPWEEAIDFCDYIVVLGYSGIVLVEAFERLSTQRTLLAVWGFHDGDMFTLGRKQGGKFIRICA